MLEVLLLPQVIILVLQWLLIRGFMAYLAPNLTSNDNQTVVFTSITFEIVTNYYDLYKKATDGAARPVLGQTYPRGIK